jgi:hypothetical protein
MMGYVHILFWILEFSQSLRGGKRRSQILYPSFKIGSNVRRAKELLIDNNRMQLGLGWPSTQCCASRGSQRTRRHFIAEVKTACREFNPLSEKI